MLRLRIGSFVVLVLLVALTPTSVSSDTDARLAAEEQKLRVLNEKLGELQAELETLDRRETSLLGELHRLDLQMRMATEELELVKVRLERGYREMDENLERIQLLEKSIAELEPFLERRARSLYKLGRLSYVRLLLSVERPSELTRAYRYVSRLAREDAIKMGRFLEDQSTLEGAKAELVGRTEAMLEMRRELETTTRTLESRRASRETLLEEVYDRKEMAGTLVHELDTAREDLGRLVDSLMAGDAPAGATVLIPMSTFEGEIGWPADGKLDGKFGTQLHPRFKTVTVRNGIEIEAPPGTTVNAVYEGEVVYASWFQGYGMLVIVQHPGNVYSLYGYLSDFQVAVGDVVARGAPIAWVGETGSLDGPRLYFEIRVDGRPVDPETWLDPARTLARAN